MPRNDREGTHLPFCLSLAVGADSIPVNWAKDEPDMSPFDQFGEMLETPHTREHLHTLNQIP